ncbi:rhodanese-like domain-containing protein [Neisseriaceae bacterium CLB008]|nr:sulfurtransferase [Neisseriaceae bacterium]
MSNVYTLSVAELAQWQQDNKPFVLLDVREDNEVAHCALPGHVHIPMNVIPLRHNELPDDAPIVVYCHHGMRSLQVAMFLKHTGFEADVYNLTGGIDAWSRSIDPSVPTY